MMRWMIIGMLVLLSGPVLAQKKMPAFRIATVNGTYVNSTDVVIKKPVLLIYFEPDCHDCQRFTGLLTREKEIFKSYKVIMITNSGMDELKRFVKTYQLDQQKDLLIGTEGWTRTVQRALNVNRSPFIVIYDKALRLTKVVDERKPEVVIKQLYTAQTKGH